MTREITDHVANPVNDRIKITVTDEPGPGGANHHYQIDIFRGDGINLYFQKGGIAENGVNGVTQEVLLAVCIDRLRCFQAGKFSCRENAIALTKMEEALHWLHSRTRERMKRGVEGTTVE